MCVYVCVCICENGVYAMCVQNLEEGIRSNGAGVKVSCGQPYVGAGKWTQFLWKMRKYFLTAEPSLCLFTK